MGLAAIFYLYRDSNVQFYWLLQSVIASVSFVIFIMDNKWFFHNIRKHLSLSIFVITSHSRNFCSFLVFKCVFDNPNLIFYLRIFLYNSWAIIFLIAFDFDWRLLFTYFLKTWQRRAYITKLHFRSLPNRCLTRAFTKIILRFFSIRDKCRLLANCSIFIFLAS